MVALAQTYEDWFFASDLISNDNELFTIVLTKMAELATTFDDWYEIFYRTPEGSTLMQTALDNMAALHKGKTRVSLDVPKQDLPKGPQPSPGSPGLPAPSQTD